jgi:hypothetical protein
LNKRIMRVGYVGNAHLVQTSVQTSDGHELSRTGGALAAHLALLDD